MARIIATAAVNAIRNEYNVLNPVSGNYEDSILLEGSRTNFFTYSEDFTNGVWLKQRITVVPNAGVNADGALTLTKIIEDSTLGEHRININTPTLTDNTVSSFSFVAKAGERTILTIRAVIKNSGVIPTSDIDLITGVVTSVVPGLTVRSTPLTNGIFRYSCSYNSNIGATVPSILWNINNGASINYTGDGVSGLYLSMFQFETDQPFSSSYIPTTNVAVTRAADNYSIPFNLPPQEMTVYCKFIEKGTQAAGSIVARIGGASSGTNPRLLLYSAAAGSAYRFFHSTPVSNVSSIQGIGVAIGDLVELRGILRSDGSVQLGQSINGGAEVLASQSGALAFATAWADTILWLPAAYIAHLNLRIARGVLTLAQMRAL